MNFSMRRAMGLEELRGPSARQRLAEMLRCHCQTGARFLAPLETCRTKLIASCEKGAGQAHSSWFFFLPMLLSRRSCRES